MDADGLEGVLERDFGDGVSDKTFNIHGGWAALGMQRHSMEQAGTQKERVAQAKMHHKRLAPAVSSSKRGFHHSPT